MRHHLKLHVTKFALLATATLIVTAMVVANGNSNPLAAVKIADVIGEGGGAVMVLVWFFLVLMGRPRGTVTNLLALGLGSLFVGLWVDMLDEFLKLPSTVPWGSMIESVPTFAGWIITTFGIYVWHREQLAITRQLRTREGDTRDHRHLDALTPVSRIAYFAAQTAQLRDQGALASIIDFDLVGFRKLNLEHGEDACDDALQIVAQVLALNLRDGDLVCRKAGDHFSILLPSTALSNAQEIALELCSAVANTSFRDHAGKRMRVRARATAMDLDRVADPANVLSPA